MLELDPQTPPSSSSRLIRLTTAKAIASATSSTPAAASGRAMVPAPDPPGGLVPGRWPDCQLLSAPERRLKRGPPG